MQKVAIFWHRRDLRVHDNAGLFHALQSGYPVVPLFIFDQDILDALEDADDARVSFIHQELELLRAELQRFGADLLVKYGRPEEVWRDILDAFPVAAVYTNRDYEPYARKRDAAIDQLLTARDIPFHSFKDHVILEWQEVLKDDGTPYTVFTPYSKKWKATLLAEQVTEAIDGQPQAIPRPLVGFPSEVFTDRFWKTTLPPTPTLESMGFQETKRSFPPKTVSQGLIRTYDKTRNFPGIEGTSRLGVHFRFGTISIREKARKAFFLNETFLNELIWRDFYAQILAHFPEVAQQPFREKYAFIPWRDDEADFERWCTGTTGFPIVDAGMRELNVTGYMHNRVRMITASFLTKHLLIDWRWGEAYFARKLLDFDLASNNGGWQWAAGCGTDAAPYFRIFNPDAQQQKFDKDLTYIRRWVPEYGSPRYPAPMVDHKEARERCLEAFKTGLAEADARGVK